MNLPQDPYQYIKENLLPFVIFSGGGGGGGQRTPPTLWFRPCSTSHDMLMANFLISFS